MPDRKEKTTTDSKNSGSFNAAYDAIYEDLRRRASHLRRQNPKLTMLTTEIVNETYINLRPSAGLNWSELPHFKLIVVTAMRHLMVDLARKRQATKRGGKDAVQVPMQEADVADFHAAEYVLDLNRALDELAQAEPRQASILELKYFGGLDNRETAQELGVSESTILRDARVAEAWLRSRLRNPGVPE